MRGFLIFLGLLLIVGGGTVAGAQFAPVDLSTIAVLDSVPGSREFLGTQMALYAGGGAAGLGLLLVIVAAATGGKKRVTPVVKPPTLSPETTSLRAPKPAAQTGAATKPTQVSSNPLPPQPTATNAAPQPVATPKPAPAPPASPKPNPLPVAAAPAAQPATAPKPASTPAAAPKPNPQPAAVAAPAPQQPQAAPKPAPSPVAAKPTPQPTAAAPAPQPAAAPLPEPAKGKPQASAQPPTRAAAAPQSATGVAPPDPRVVNRKRVQDLVTINDALKAYHAKNGAYPRADGLAGAKERGPQWIPGLAPDFLAELPRDPVQGANSQYVYASDGANYKLLAQGASLLGSGNVEVLGVKIDPTRNPTPQNAAFGFWTPPFAKA